jgi:hypothetical protein
MAPLGIIPSLTVTAAPKISRRVSPLRNDSVAKDSEIVLEDDDEEAIEKANIIKTALAMANVILIIIVAFLGFSKFYTRDRKSSPNLKYFSSNIHDSPMKSWQFLNLPRIIDSQGHSPI